MSLTANNGRTARLDLRMTPDLKSIIERAADRAGMSNTDYVMSKVIPSARQEIIESETISLNAQQWDEFLAFLDEPDSERAAEFRKFKPQWGVKLR